MEIIRDPKIQWLSFKWIFIGLSTILVIAGAASLLSSGLNLGVDFEGGTLVYVKFTDTPDLERIRRVLGSSELGAEQVNRFDTPDKNEVQIRMPRIESDEAVDLTQQSELVLDVLHQEFDPGKAESDQLDLNNVSTNGLADRLRQLSPETLDEETDHAEHYMGLARQVITARNQLGGVFKSLDDLNGLNLSSEVQKALQENFYLGSFNLISVESVGPKVGRELRDRAQSAVGLAMLGMLIYIAFRFRPIYGLAALAALFHDIFITLGFFSISEKEISLTVIAALLTLVGYSINDTIVIFDRVRENQRLMRRAGFTDVINTSINQTLNRTILTSVMTLAAALALYLLGGPALNGFSFALVVGIIVGTYSSVAIASPIVLWWQDYQDARKGHSR